MSATENTIKLGLYRHYKGPYYKVLEVARHSETEEQLVVYQALYGDKGTWVRPLSMFCETVELDDQTVPRFAYTDPQTEVLEVAVLNVKQGQESEFEAAFAQAETIIASMSGYINHSLSCCIEKSGQYLLLVSWQTLESHEKSFRQSAEYQRWKALLHHFYEPFPSVEHYRALDTIHN